MMKIQRILLAALVAFNGLAHGAGSGVSQSGTFSQYVSIGKGSPAASNAALDIASTTKGVLLPRMTTTQQNAITGTAGLLLYDNVLNRPSYYNGSAYLNLASITGTETLTNKTLSGNTATNLISGSGILTLNTSGTVTVPNATDTLVGKATSDTLTNKVLTGNTAINLISGSGTIVHNTTGTMTVPNGTDTLAGLTLSQTLTNKVLTGNTAVNLISGSGTLTLNTTGTMTVPNGTDTMVALALSQTLTNKTITSPAINGANFAFGTASNTNRLVLPTNTTGNLAGFTNTQGLIAYDTTLNKPVYNDGSAWTAVGSGSGGGGAKNYLGTINGTNNNGDFETASVGSWSMGTTGTLTNGIPTGTPSFGSGASGNLSITTVTSGSQNSGTYSLSIVSSAATTAGNMVHSPAFTIDKSDQSSVMGVLFTYKAATNPTNANYSGLAASTSYAWAVYDVTNSTWIPPTSGGFCFIQSTGVGVCKGSFQTSASGTSYRFAIYNVNATSGAVTIYADDFTLGPQAVPTDGPLIVFSGSTAAAGAVTANVTNIPVTAIKDTNAGWTGSTYVIPKSGDYALSGLLVGPTVTTVSAYVNAVSNQPIGVVPSSNISATLAGHLVNLKAGDIVSIRCDVSQTLTVVRLNLVRVGGSEQPSDGRVVATYVTGTATSVTNAFGAITPTTINKDSHAGWSGNAYTVPVSGFYDITGYIQTGSVAWTAGHGVSIAYTVNGGTQINLGNVRITASSTVAHATSGAGLVYVNAGDVIRFAAYADVTNTPLGFFGSIARRNGAQDNSPNVTVSAYYTGAPPTGTLNGSANLVTFGTKVSDSHNAYSSGTYTIPVSGRYAIAAGTAQNGTYSAGQVADTLIYVNGASKVEGVQIGFTGAGTLYPAVSIAAYPLVAGDLVTIRTLNSSTTPTFASAASVNFFSIVRVGN